MILSMTKEDKDIETIARAVSQRRNELRFEAYKDDPEGLETVKKRNLETYGDEFGPTPDSLFEKYGSWQKVLEKALGTNPGMDACLGLYDDYYDLYAAVGMISFIKPLRLRSLQHRFPVIGSCCRAAQSRTECGRGRSV